VKFDAAAEQELDALEPLAEAHSEVAGLLHRPLARGVGGNAAQVHPAGAVLNEHQHVQPSQQHRPRPDHDYAVQVRHIVDDQGRQPREHDSR
jgi:hypothetical protein